MSFSDAEPSQANQPRVGNTSQVMHVWEGAACRLDVVTSSDASGPELDQLTEDWNTVLVEVPFGLWEVSRDRETNGRDTNSPDLGFGSGPRVRVGGNVNSIIQPPLINRARVGDTGGNRFNFQVSLDPLPAEQTIWSIEGSADEALQLTRDWRSGAVDHAKALTLTTTVDALDPTPVAFVQSAAGVAQGRSGAIPDRRSNASHLHHVAVIHDTGWIVSRDRDGEDNVWTLSVFSRISEQSGAAEACPWKAIAIIRVHVYAGPSQASGIGATSIASYLDERPSFIDASGGETKLESEAATDVSGSAGSTSWTDRATKDRHQGVDVFTLDDAEDAQVSAPGLGSAFPFLRPFAAAIARVDAMIQSSPVGRSRLSWTGFWFGMVVYAVTRLWRVEAYPIAFDGDEAGIVALAQGLLEGRFRDGFGILFPIFFPYPNWNPDVGVYVHLITSSLFGVSVVVARATAVLLSSPTPIAIAFTLKVALGNRSWWLAPLVVAALPMWFHLSRSAYDSATWVAFYACFVGAYFAYRYQHPRHAWLVVVFGALTFYSNSIAHLIIGASIFAFIIIDFSYHRRYLSRWRNPSIGAIVAIVPLLIFLNKNPGYFATRTNSAHPYWASDGPSFLETGLQMGKSFLLALDPRVWFSGIERTKVVDVTGYHNYYPGTMPLLPLWLAPFILAGIACLAMPRFRAYRWQIFAVLAVSISPALVARFAPTRSLAVVIPVTILAVVGIDIVPRAFRHTRLVGALIFAAVATTGSFMVLNDALTTQSTRRQDYGGYGIQWGSQYVFNMVNARLKATPGSRVMVTTDWNWGGHHFIDFFVSREDRAAGRVFLGSIDTLIHGQEPWGPELWAVMSPAQLEAIDEYIANPGGATGRPRIIADQVTETVLHPDGTPGFLLVRLLEAPDVRAILTAERESRRRLSFVTVAIDGDRAVVGYTNLDDGAIPPVFGRTTGALARLAGPNPAVLDVAFGNPRPVRTIRVTVGASLWRVTAQVHVKDGSVEVKKSGEGVPDGGNSIVEINLDAPIQDVSRVRLEINQLNASDEDSTVHLYRVEFR